MAAGQINVYGKFHSSTGEGILAVTGEIKDEHFNKTQAELNLEFSENQGGVSSVAGLTGDILAADLLEALNLDDVVSNVSVLMQRTNWDNYFGIDQETGAIFVKPIDENTPRGFYSLGYISAGGVGSSQGGGGGGADLLDVWVSLRDNNPGEDFYNWKINPGHIPGLPWSQITSGKPTTLSGYGITDSYTKTQVDNLIGAIDLTPYLLASVAAQTYATITSLDAVSARVSVLEGRTNWDDYLGVDDDGNIYVKMNGQDARGFYSYGFIAAGGVGSSGGGGGEGASLLAVWRSLTNNNSLVDADITNTLKIATAHIPDVSSVYGYLKNNETITLTGVVTGSGTTTIATSIADGAISISKINGLGDAATYGIGSVESGDNGLVTGGAVYSAIASAVAAEAELRLAADNALSARIAVFEGMFELVDGNIHVKNNRGFYSDSFISAGGVGTSSGGGGGADLLDVWVSLRDNNPNEDFYNWKVNAGHLPLGSGLTVDANGNINVGTAGSVAWANVTGKPTTVSGYGITDAVTSASYNSTTKRIELKCGNVVISYIDATAFIKDGMVSNVQVTGGYLVISFNTDAGQEDIRIPISDIFNADNYYDKTASDARFFLAANFTAANIVSTLGNTPVARASRLDGDTALSIWGVEYWANGVPKAVSARPGLYVAGTQVNINANKDTLLGVTAISNGLSSGSSDESRIEWDATNHAWHFYGGIYADTFVTAGGTNASSGGGGEGASLLVVWRSLTNDNTIVDADITSTLKIAGAHIPDMSSTYGYLKGNQTITLTGVVTGSGTTSIATSIADGALSIAKVDGLQSALNGKQDTISDLSTIRDRSDEGHIVYGYFSNGVLVANHIPDLSSTYQPLDADLTAIAALAGTSGLLKKTAANTWALDTNAYLTGNETITLSGDVSGSGTTSITVSIGDGKVTNAMLAGGIENSKLVNSSVTIGSTTISLGGTSTTLAGLTSVTSQKFYLNANTYFELDSSGYVHLVHPSGKGFYVDGFIAAGGTGSSSGGGGGIDIDRVWESLTNNTDKPNVKFNQAHLPALSTSGGVTASYGSTTSGSGLADTLNISIPANTFAPYNSAGYLPLSGGTMTGAINYSGSIRNGTPLISQGVSEGWDYTVILAAGWDSTNDDFTDIRTAGSSNNTGYLRITANGSVGINVPSPSAMLHVNGSIRNQEGSANFACGDETSSFVAGGIEIRKDAIFKTYIQAWEGNPLVLNPYGNNIGVYTSDPQYRLDVAGTFNANTIYQNGTTLDNTYLALSGGTMNNTNVVTNLNADLLDGYHESSFLRCRSTTSTTGEDTLWNQIGVKQYENALPDALAAYFPDAYTYGEVISLCTSNARFDIYANHGSTSLDSIYVRSGWNTDKQQWKRLAFTDSNVDSATTLQTSRSLWGNSFNGSADVAGSITFNTISYFRICVGPTDVWSDGTRYHPWYGYDKRAAQDGSYDAGVYSTTISDYYGLTLRTYGGYISMKNNGDVGIGTPNPSCKLDVSGTFYASGNSSIGGTFGVTGATTLTGALTVNNTASISGNTTIGGTLAVTWNTTLNGDLTVYGDTFFHSDIYLYTNMALYLDEYGNNALYYDPTEGTIRFTFDYDSHFTDGIYSDSYITAGGVASSSDARLKDNIQSIGYDKAIDMLSRLRGCEWTWNEKKSCLEGKHGSGLIAQEVESVMPWAVLKLNGGELSLTYDSLWGVAIPVMQSHEERLQEAERKIAVLEAENAELRARLNN